MNRTVYTIGHSTHPLETFLRLLETHAITTVLDIRRYPGSRHSPQYNADALSASLRARGISYRHDARLGGRRHGHIEGSGNEGWRHPSFRAYADYASTDPTFTEGLAALEHDAQRPGARLAYLCSEQTHYQCHRRIVSDYLLARGWRVLHIRPDGTLVAHEVTTHASVHGVDVRYPASPLAEVQLPLPLAI